MTEHRNRIKSLLEVATALSFQDCLRPDAGRLSTGHTYLLLYLQDPESRDHYFLVPWLFGSQLGNFRKLWPVSIICGTVVPAEGENFRITVCQVVLLFVTFIVYAGTIIPAFTHARCSFVHSFVRTYVLRPRWWWSSYLLCTYCIYLHISYAYHIYSTSISLAHTTLDTYKLRTVPYVILVKNSLLPHPSCLLLFSRYVPGTVVLEQLV